jgi:hypothetical protein
MSENVSLTSADGVPPNIQRILAKLEAEPLAVNRDELFFQAGYASGWSSRTSRFFWPSAGAALLFVSVGLAAVLAHHIIRSGLAPGHAVAVNQAPPQPLAESVSDNAQPSMPADSRSRLWQRVVSSTALPRGQLTAIGWSEPPAKAGSGQSAVGSDESPQDSSPRRPSTYLELMRSHNRG